MNINLSEKKNVALVFTVEVLDASHMQVSITVLDGEGKIFANSFVAHTNNDVRTFFDSTMMLFNEKAIESVKMEILDSKLGKSRLDRQLDKIKNKKIN